MVVCHNSAADGRFRKEASASSAKLCTTDTEAGRGMARLGRIQGCVVAVHELKRGHGCALAGGGLAGDLEQLSSPTFYRACIG